MDAGDPITLSAGDQSTTLDPSARPVFEVNVEREGPADGPTELSVELSSRSSGPKTATTAARCRSSDRPVLKRLSPGGPEGGV